MRPPDALIRRRRFLTSSAAATSAVALGVNADAAENANSDTRPRSLPKLPGRTPNTQFAVNLEMWFKGKLESRVREAARLGFPAVDFWPYQGRDIDAVAAALREHEMIATQFTAWPFGTELNHPDEKADEFLEAVEESCAVAEKLPGCRLFTVVVGNNIEGLSKRAMHDAAIAKIKLAVPILAKHQKTIIIEPMNPYNHPGHCLYGSADAIAICQQVDSEWVKINWDLFHMQRYEGNLIDNLRNGKAYIGYVQLADSPDRNEPGTGEINYTQIFKVLKEIGYSIPVGLECFPAGGDVVRAAQRIHAADTW